MASSAILQTYEALERLSHQMLQAARNAEWEVLVSLEQDCRTLVDDLAHQPPDDQLAARRQHIIRRILADDAEIRDLATPWMAQSKQFLTSLRLERTLLERLDTDQPP
jgi:flagellar protein FliT